MPEQHVETEVVEQVHISDLIENAPSWLLRSGTTTLAALVVLMVTFSAFIRYPDKVQGTGVITTAQPPIALLAAEAGRVEQLLASNNARVAEGDPILFIRNAASFADVTRLTQELGLLVRVNAPLGYAEISLPELTSLGMMQDGYMRLRQQCEALQLLLEQANVQRLEADARTQEINRIGRLNKSLQREKALFSEELALKQKDYQRQKELEQTDAISALEFENNKRTFLQSQRQYEGMETGIINNGIRIAQLQLQAIQLEAEYKQQLEAASIEIKQSIGLLQAAIKVWEQRYIIKAETTGAITLAKDVQHNTFLEAGSLVGYIVPSNTGSMLVKVNVPVASSGKMEAGQKLLLKIPAYPYKEYGLLTTEIATITTMALTNSTGQQYYEIRGSLPDALISSYGKPIPYKPNMQVTAEIISKDKSLFQRIFSQFLNLVKNV